MVRRMLSCKKRLADGVLEGWLAWQKGTFRFVQGLLVEHDAALEVALAVKRKGWVGHLARFGNESKAPHLAKLLTLWRPLSCWRWQQGVIQRGLSTFRHPTRFKPRSWEEQFPADWLQEACRPAP